MDLKTLSLILILIAAAPLCAYDSSPALSPDGLFVAFERNDEQADLPDIVVSSVQSPSCQVVGQGRRPIFNPTGKTLLYTVDSPGTPAPAAWRNLGLGSVHTNIYVVGCDGSEARQLTRGGGVRPTWSSDGSEIAYLNASGELCRLSAGGGLPKRIASKIPCVDCLVWLHDLNSFTATMDVKGKLARYAFTPPSTTPVRISTQHSVPAGALAPRLAESGRKLGYFVRRSVGEGNQPSEYLEMWVSWGTGKRKVADIPLEVPLTVFDRKNLSITFSEDEKLGAAACAGKIWVVEFATGNTMLVSVPVLPLDPEAAPPSLNEPTGEPDNMEAKANETVEL